MEKRSMEKVEILKKWINKQPHLPHKNHDILLLRFLTCCNDSIEIAKKLIDLYYSMRPQIPEVFVDRDPAHPDIQNIFKVVEFLPLPKFTKENYQILVYRLKTSDAENFDYLHAAKAFSIISDIRLLEESCLADGEVPIFDAKYFSMKHFSKVVFPVMRKQAIYSQEALPIRLKQIHFVNASPFLEKLLMLIKPVLKSEVLKTVHVHLPNSDTLFDYIPRDRLPEEYGGTIGKCEEFSKMWLEKMMSRRDYLVDEGYWKVDESKRPIGDDNVSQSQHFGMQGSFKSLSID